VLRKGGRPRPQPSDYPDGHGRARERLIERRDIHIDQLADKLREPRVRKVISELLGDDIEPGLAPPSEDDQLYVQDLGLIRTRPQIEIANPIYREIIPRALTWVAQTRIPQETVWYVGRDGRLDFSKLLNGFQQFFRENGEIWIERFDYKEAGLHYRCRRSCNASSTVVGGSIGNMGWAVGVPICWYSGPWMKPRVFMARYNGWSSSSSSCTNP